MLFVLSCLDKPNSNALRMEIRPRHLAYIEAHRAMIKLAGPFVGEDGQTMVGSMLIIEAADLAAAKSFAANDPYALGGLFAHTELRPWKWTLNAPKD